ncbi:MAG: UDP-N-acetylglucosamine 2-epimerase (non-hydrolyzing) [Burkholderiales bacterium]|nr:UDP-N-acetylglucosamine 2-epimerase (non-hydrolyzing) [Burkholderiales bacterium]
MKKVLSVVGARPQFVKAAMVSRALGATRGIAEVLVHTGQHYDRNMSAVFFRELGVPRPRLNLGIGSAAHGAQTGRMLEALERAMMRERPHRVLVYGDTNSTLAGALAAAKLRIPVAHVEAGLRSFDRSMPEEVNRVAADHVSDLLFAPTSAAVANLRGEGVAARRIMLTGDVMFDAALFYAERAERRSTALARLGLARGHYVLATVHRAGNTDEPRRLAAIFGALARLATECPVLVPVHPRTRAALARAGVRESPGLILVEPVGYLDMVMLEKNARLIATDSGGVQKEAYFHRVPCATLRERTEWVELVRAGWNRLVPPVSAARVHRDLRRMLTDFRRPAAAPGLYGAGDAARRIAAALRAR